MAELDRGLGQQQSCWRLAHMVVDTLATGVDLASPPSEVPTGGRYHRPSTTTWTQSRPRHARGGLPQTEVLAARLAIYCSLPMDHFPEVAQGMRNGATLPPAHSVPHNQLYLKH